MDEKRKYVYDGTLAEELWARINGNDYRFRDRRQFPVSEMFRFDELAEALSGEGKSPGERVAAIHQMVRFVVPDITDTDLAVLSQGDLDGLLDAAGLRAEKEGAGKRVPLEDGLQHDESGSSEQSSN